MKVLVKNLHNEKVDLFRSVLAEFVGTAILVIFTCGTCMSTSINNSGDALVCTAVSFGFTVACLVAALGHVSGCHINPAVTVGLLANGKCTLLKAAIYIASQLLGGIAGASLLYALLPDPGNLCSTVLIKVTPLQGIIVEALICFLLVFVICNVCESNASNAPLLIGLAVTTGHLFAVSFAFFATFTNGMRSKHSDILLSPVKVYLISVNFSS
ncbi:Aquaporin AQPAe.a-like protein [Dinothrombium tinctorium]|uniref:Aquaporin AQPAe.a-like protein n=1 Tax=Dinothrombium tinctorium TaxID=1965070 RepID=A0A3S3Q3C1_9ACAR|nr:Aquaporin AQPAe.a-like protein [Dinothrombium tinctorium]RWS02652.1 Aquaporin AQPAe.a-like protein [Dinothrombium tinctorium]